MTARTRNALEKAVASFSLDSGAVDEEISDMQTGAAGAKAAAKNERRQRESFRKRKKTLFKNADAMAKRCKADVYIVLVRKGRWFTYTSTEKLGWPPTAESMANVYPLPVALTAKDFETTKPGESGSEAGNSQANSPDDDMRDSPWEPVEESPQTREAPTARMMESKRSFLIPRAPKFEVESTD